MDSYSVSINNNQVGTVTVEREGLFVKILCILHKGLSGAYRLIMHTKSKKLDLGICLPYENFFGLKTNVAQKYVKDEIVSFVLKTNNKDEDGMLVETDNCFSTLECIINARYTFRNNGGVICFD